MTYRLKPVAIIILAALSLTGCGDRGSDKDTLVGLIGEPISISEDFDGWRIMFIVDDTAFVESYSSAEYTHQTAAIAGDSMSTVMRFGHRGSGPGEFLQAAIGIANDKTPYLIGNTNGSLKAAKISVTDNGRAYVSEFPPLSERGMSFITGEFIVKDDSTLLLIAAPWEEPQNLFGQYNLRTGAFTPLRYWPEDGFDGSRLSKFMYYADNSKILSDHNDKYLYSAGNGRKSFIFTVNGDDVSVEHILYDDPARYEADTSGLNYGYHYDGLEYAVTANDSIIIFLNREFMRDGRRPGEREYGSYGNELTVWNWNGEKIGSYELDNYVYGINLNSSDNTFYARAKDPETEEDLMWRYRIIM